MIRGIPVNEVEGNREGIFPHLEPVAKKCPDGTTAESYWESLVEGTLQAWCVNDFEALVVTEIMPESVRILWCSGKKRKAWQDAVDEKIRAWARALGKKRVVCNGRLGWRRFAEERGYNLVFIEMAVEV